MYANTDGDMQRAKEECQKGLHRRGDTCSKR